MNKKKITSEMRFEGVEEFESGMNNIGVKMPSTIFEAVVDSCVLVERQAKTKHLAGQTLKAHTHRLQQSVKTMIRPTANTVSGRVGSPVVYAAIQEFGGIIKPKKAKYLVFNIGGRWIRAKQVKIPKSEWLLKSTQDVQGQIETLFGRKVEIVIG